MPFVLPADPSDGAVAPASWGDEVRDGLNFLANPPTCIVWRNSAQSLASGTGTNILWNIEHVDTDSMHSTTVNTERITINTAGVYQIDAGIYFFTNSTAGRRELSLVTGVGLILAHAILPPAQVANMMTISRKWKFAAGEYFVVQGMQDSGVAVNVGEATHPRTFVTASWVGLG